MIGKWRANGARSLYGLRSLFRLCPKGAYGESEGCPKVPWERIPPKSSAPQRGRREFSLRENEIDLHVIPDSLHVLSRIRRRRGYVAQVSEFSEFQNF